MTITSFWFLIFVVLGVLIYYVIPKKLQWLELLFLSVLFYWFAATPYTIVYLIAVTVIAYTATLLSAGARQKENGLKKSWAITGTAIAAILVIWLVIKGRGLWYPVLAKILTALKPSFMEGINGFQPVAALGMGYFTLQIVGYVIDCYWENEEPQKNPLKLFLFVGWFPQLTTGPISRYGQLKTLFEGHAFRYENICMGAQRILWGFFKKLVIAERLGILVSGINGDFTQFHGVWSWVLLLIYPLQMYTDFSGCMDIVIGVSELFDIRLAENFNNPFFARSSQEFWQRWHITLGTWAKDYVLYPLLKWGPMIRFGKVTRKKCGKKWGKFLKNCVGMLCLWMVMGIWHGGYRYILGVSLWYWVILMLGNLLTPWFVKVTAKLGMKVESFSWHLFQSARTYLIYAVGAVFFLRGVFGGADLLKDCFRVLFVRGYANPWVLFDGTVVNTGITWRDLNLILIGIVLMIVVAILREKYGYARIWAARQGVVFRWLVWCLLFVIVLIYGMYGSGYEASAFIYQGF